jgi:hypothetical protein
VADSSVAITAGSGTNIDTFAIAGGDHQQIVREAKATAVTTNSWTVAITASTSQIAADPSRVRVLMVAVGTTGRVWLRFDSSAPTSAIYHVYLDPDDRYEVPIELSCLAVSMLGQTAAGTVQSLLATAA